MGMRKASLAGMWYPGTPEQCRSKIESMMTSTPSQSAMAGIVPHAGWEYSGSVAVQVFQALAAVEPRPELLLLFGTHMGPNNPGHISRAPSFETPFGPLEAAVELIDDLATSLKLQDDPADSGWGRGDNTIEVQLPFIKHILPETRIVVIGPPASEEAIEIGETAVRKARELGVPLAIIGSTDLTHYGPNYGFLSHGTGEEAVRWVKDENDRRLIDRVLELDAPGVISEARSSHNACVPGAVAAALAGAMELGATKATLLDYRTSYDIQPSTSFVGYAAVVMH